MAQMGDYTGNLRARQAKGKAQSEVDKANERDVVKALAAGLPENPAARQAALDGITAWVKQISRHSLAGV